MDIHFGKASCPDAFDGKHAGEFRTWRIKVSNNNSKYDGNKVEVLLGLKAQPEDHGGAACDMKAKEGRDDDEGHAKLSQILCRPLLAITFDNANWIVQSGGHRRWRGSVAKASPSTLSDNSEHPERPARKRSCLAHPGGLRSTEIDERDDTSKTKTKTKLNLIKFYSILFYSIPFHSIPFRSVPFRSVPFRSVPFRSVPFRSVLSCPVLSCPVLSCPVLSCPVLSCPVLSCSVKLCLYYIFLYYRVLYCIVFYYKKFEIVSHYIYIYIDI